MNKLLMNKLFLVLMLAVMALGLTACLPEKETPEYIPPYVEPGNTDPAPEEPVEEPVEEQPVDEQPVEGEPVEGEPVEEQPVDEQSVDPTPEVITNKTVKYDKELTKDVWESGKPTFATVATSGNYNDLTNNPSMPSLLVDNNKSMKQLVWTPIKGGIGNTVIITFTFNSRDNLGHTFTIVHQLNSVIKTYRYVTLLMGGGEEPVDISIQFEGTMVRVNPVGGVGSNTDYYFNSVTIS